MRRWVAAAVLTMTAHGACAADMPDLWDNAPLRGGITELSSTSVNWQGVYVGGHIGYTGANMDLSNATQSLTAYMLQNTFIQGPVSGWTLLGKANPDSVGFGGFVGYNAQWDDVLLGVEGSYTHLSNLSGSQSNTLPAISITGTCVTPPAGDVDQCAAQLSGAATATVTDVATFRGRAGWAVGNFLPYMFGGLAVGRVNVTTSATVKETDTFYNTTTNAFDGSQSSTLSQSQTNIVYAYGYTAGLGLEAMLTRGLFARGEYEYIKFNAVNNISIQLNTVRVGLGYKF